MPSERAKLYTPGRGREGGGYAIVVITRIDSDAGEFDDGDDDGDDDDLGAAR